MSAHEHRAGAPAVVRFVILTVSDTRTEEDDESGQLIAERITSSGHVVTTRALCRDEPTDVRKLVQGACGRDDVDSLVITGGTGLARRDSTYEAVAGLYEVEIPGFGELFRSLSFEEIGAAAMLSRASAGLVSGRPVFSLPGSKGAVRLAMDRLILPEIGHVLAQVRGR